MDLGNTVLSIKSRLLAIHAGILRGIHESVKLEGFACLAVGMAAPLALSGPSVVLSTAASEFEAS